MEQSKFLIMALLIAAAAIGLVNVFLIPPFMNPDEVQHFMYSAGVAYSKKELTQIDPQVLSVLKERRWFHHIGIGPGWQSVRKIEDIYFLNRFQRDKSSVSRSQFHFVYGKLLGLTGIRDVLKAFYFLRMISFLLYFITFVLCVRFYRKYFPDYWLYMALGQLLILQLSGIATALNYDVLLTLLGVLFFICGHVFFVTGEKRYILAMVFLAGLSSLVKTGGLLFFVYCFLLILFKYPFNRRSWARLGLSAIIFVIVFSWLNYWFPERFFNTYTALFAKLKVLAVAFAGDSGGLWSLGFFNSILDSFYFYTGWMGFKLETWWYVGLKLFLLSGVVGGFIILLRRKAPEHAIAGERRWLSYTLVVIIFQILSIRLYYDSGVMAQGRYLYPLLIPVIIFVYLGLGALERKLSCRRDYLTLSFLIFQSLFFLMGVLRIISVFYFEVASPHAGL